MKHSAWLMVAAAVALCVEWTRLSGTVKIINLKTSTVTIQNKEGDLLTVPVDYQVKIAEKDGTLVDIKRLALDQKIILTRTLQEKPVEDMTGMAPPEPAQRGL